MKNPNQANAKSAQNARSARDQKNRLSTLTPQTLPVASPATFLPAHPFSQQDSCEIILDWIGDTMEPEVCQGGIAQITKRQNMYPCAGELVVGLLKTGHFVFGAHEVEHPGICRIAFINPKYAPVYYPEKHFLWLLPVDRIVTRDAAWPYYIKTEKQLFHYAGDF